MTASTNDRPVPFSAGLIVRFRRWLPHLVTISLGMIVLAAYSSYNRPIWYDEFLQFAFGGMRSTEEAWRYFREISTGVNHGQTGQTGVYIMINYWTLHAFGASRLLLRLPSLLSGCLLLVAFLRLANRLGFGLWWTCFLMVSLLNLPILMGYTSEARPYMPLAAAVAGTFACYLQPRETRGGMDRAIGAIAIVVGVLFHPYFGLYWMVLAFLTFARRPAVALGSGRARLSAFIRHCEPWVAFPATVVYFVLAGHSWLLGSLDFRSDPFQFIPVDKLSEYFFVLGHFEFLGGWWFGGPIIMLLAGALLCLRSPGHDEPARQQAMTALLVIVTALALSFVISCISYFNSYWIIPRQWVASFGLACFGFVWLMRECVTLLGEHHRRLGLALTAAFALLLLSNSIPRFQKQLYAFSGPVAAAKVRDSRVGTPTLAGGNPVTDDDWVALANANLDTGGPVWPIFREYYAGDVRGGPKK